MQIDVILGLQWGDEGKGKIVDYLATNYQMVARFQGGPNAGHTLHFDGQKFVLHTVPSGIFRPGLLNLIGNGVVLDPIVFRKELESIEHKVPDYASRLLLGRKAHLILPTHKLLDAASEAAKGKLKIGSTLKGIGPTYMDKTGRNGIRLGDIEAPNFLDRYKALKAKHLDLLRLYPDFEYALDIEEDRWFEGIEHLKELQFVDSEYLLHDTLAKGHRVLAEGAQGSMLDIDFGTYPFVTSSNTVAAGVCSGLGVPPKAIGEVIGISKAYCTRVGGGPFPTELNDETGAYLRKQGNEFGSTTGRPRRCGWIDLAQLRYSIIVNGVTQIALTKIDVMNELERIAMGVGYANATSHTDRLPYDITATDLEPEYEWMKGWQSTLEGIRDFDAMPKEAKSFIERLEKDLGVPITYVSTSPQRDDLIVR